MSSSSSHTEGLVQTVGILTIKLIKGTKLKNADLIGQSDPQVIFTNGRQVAKSKVIDDTCNPDFKGENLSLCIESKSIPIKMHVVDIDTFSEDVLGDAELSISGLKSGADLDVRDIPLNTEGSITIALSYTSLVEEKVDEELDKLRSGQVCVDCGNKKIEWASVSLGAWLCIACSGVHRSLGTDISKVRSVDLDVWGDEQKKGMLASNDFNSVFEGDIPSSVQKITPSSSRDEREKYIKQKYVKLAFADKNLKATKLEELVNNARGVE
mmetsp:Transcript_35394/g.51854  ORF Transcript_35394/g.51854 Transcript_35394/m.51854 type:complete len:268 (-) Transcript_35394:86-889(-)